MPYCRKLIRKANEIVCKFEQVRFVDYSLNNVFLLLEDFILTYHSVLFQ